MPATTPWRRTFLVFYTGESIAISGLELTTYAIWGHVLSRLGQPLWLLIFILLWYLPFIVASPFAGSLVDRWGARRSMVVASAAGGLNFATLALLSLLGAPQVAPILFVCTLYVAVTLKTFHLAAFDAAVPFLVPKQSLARANGMRLLVTAGAAILGVVVSRPLLGALGLYGVLAMGCLCYAFALLTLRRVWIAKPSRSPLDTAPGPLLRSLLTEFGWAWRYVVSRRGLVSLLGVIALAHLALSTTEAYWLRMTVSFAARDEIVYCVVIGFAGAVVGSALMATRGSVRRLARTIGISSLVLAGAMVLGSLRPSVPLLAIAAFLLLGAAPILVGAVQTLMQLKVPPGMLGRTAAMRNLSNCIPYMGARIASLLVVLPWVSTRDVDNPWLATVVGSGPGRGIAMATLVIGVVLVLSFLFVYLRTSLRRVEHDLPDVTPHDPDSESTPSGEGAGAAARDGSAVGPRTT